MTRTRIRDRSEKSAVKQQSGSQTVTNELPLIDRDKARKKVQLRASRDEDLFQVEASDAYESAQEIKAEIKSSL